MTIVPRSNVSVSKWIGGRLPAWTAISRAHEVARLTRRHPWVRRVLTLFGRHPRPQRFRGRAIGWGRLDVERSPDSIVRARSRDQYKAPRRKCEARHGSLCRRPCINSRSVRRRTEDRRYRQRIKPMELPLAHDGRIDP